jgi:hypothetical protein
VDPHGSSGTARGGRWRPLRRKQRTRSGGTANCSWRIWRWPGASRPWPSRSEGGGPGGIVLVRPRMQAGVFCQRPARFHRRVHVQGNRPRASRLGASGVRAERERSTGDATRRGDPAGGYAGVPTVFLQHTCMSRGGLAHEQEDPEVHGGVGIANQSGPIGFSQKSTTSSSSYPSLIARARPQHLEEAPGPPSSLFNPCMPEHHCLAKPTTATIGHREEYPSGHSPPTTIP